MLGCPLVRGVDDPFGALRGESVAVKDVFDVAGFAVGAGNPHFLTESRAATRNAPAVASLLAAGADVRGIAQTDEFAYSIAGQNMHYGTPPNRAALGAIPGGSSSGPAAAVASGHASIGLGTDTAGSIRVPASYQGLWGLRTTHGAVDTAGVLPLAPRFDVVGWLTRTSRLLRAAAVASLESARQVEIAEHVVVPAPPALAPVGADVRSAFDEAVTRLVALGKMAAPEEIEIADLDEALSVFQTVQAAEAWQSHGAWVSAHRGALGAAVADRFRYAESVTPDQHTNAIAAVLTFRAELDEALAGRVLLLPTTPTPAPQLDANAEAIATVRRGTLTLTCLAGIGGYPSLSIPALRVRGAPVGLGLVGPRFADLALVDLGKRLAEALNIGEPAAP